MNKILIGSKAIRHWYPDFTREPKDTDYATDVERKSGVEVEYLYNPVLFKYTNCEVLNPDMLLTLKVSHLFWDVNWDKHMYDAQFLLKKGATIQKPLFLELLSFWKEYLPKIHRSNLQQNADDFFNNVIEYDHDYLHTLIKNPPTYLKVLKDGEEVLPCEKKFHSMSHEEKCDLVREEVYVMAYERYNNVPFYVAYGRMLRKFIREHAPVWEMLFIVENYIELHKPKFDFITEINKHDISRIKREIKRPTKISTI